MFNCRCQVEPSNGIHDLRILGQCPQLLVLRRGIAHPSAEDQLQILPIEMLGLLDVLCPQSQGGRRRRSLRPRSITWSGNNQSRPGTGT